MAEDHEFANKSKEDIRKYKQEVQMLINITQSVGGLVNMMHEVAAMIGNENFPTHNKTTNLACSFNKLDTASIPTVSCLVFHALKDACMDDLP